MKTSEALQKALDKLDGGKAWCKGAYAATSSDSWVDPDSPLACKFCATGAVISVPRALSSNPLKYLLYAVRERGGKHISIPAFNDKPTTTFEDVKAAFERAIELAKAEGN